VDLDQLGNNMTNTQIERIKLREIRKGNLAILEHIQYLPYITLSMIHTTVQQVLGCVPNSSRDTDSAWFRFYVFYFTKKYTNLSLSNIGKLYGKDHASVLHGIRRIENNLDNPSMPEIRTNIKKIKEILKLV
jgi:chromosomal replication initiator protein